MRPCGLRTSVSVDGPGASPVSGLGGDAVQPAQAVGAAQARRPRGGRGRRRPPRARARAARRAGRRSARPPRRRGPSAATAPGVSSSGEAGVRAVGPVVDSTVVLTAPPPAVAARQRAGAAARTARAGPGGRCRPRSRDGTRTSAASAAASTDGDLRHPPATLADQVQVAAVLHGVERGAPAVQLGAGHQPDLLEDREAPGRRSTGSTGVRTRLGGPGVPRRRRPWRGRGRGRRPGPGAAAGSAAARGRAAPPPGRAPRGHPGPVRLRRRA